MTLPRIATRDEWLAARKELLAKEKELTRDARRAEHRAPQPADGRDRRRTTCSTGPDGTARLLDLFEGRRQLIIYHFMFDPEWEDGCPSCTAGTDELSDGLLDHLHTRDTSYAMVSRAPLEKLERWKAKQGWDVPVVLVVRHRLQLRLRRHDRRVGRAAGVQLPHARRVRGDGLGLLRGRAAVRDAGPQLLPAGRRPRVPHVLAVRPRRSSPPAARTTSSTSPRSAGRRTGRSRRAARRAPARPPRTS